MDPDRARVTELSGNLARLRSRVVAACEQAGRDPAEVTIIAVTKNFPAADVVRLARLGIGDIGENRDQEARAKFDEVARHGVAVRRHFVGRLQRNKARSVAGYADMVHSVDSVRLATALGSAASDQDRRLEVLVQVSVDGDPTRGGTVTGQVPAVAEAVDGQPALRLRGVMAVAPQTWLPLTAYQHLAEVARTLRRDHPEASVISAGMSNDLDAALACGATHLRIGSALLGNRPPLR
jgi:PLP dependent protein